MSDLIPLDFIKNIRSLIQSAKSKVAHNINSELVQLYWTVGFHIHTEILATNRADYGKKVIAALADQLTLDYGQGFSRRNLFNMVRFAQTFPDFTTVQTLSAQLNWSHIIEVIYIEDSLKRDFYTQMCQFERWSVRHLRSKIQGMLFERTAISRKPEKLIKQELETLKQEDRLTPDLTLRDPYLLDFLNLKETYSEKDFESAILRELGQFMLEFGSDFSFIARQKRITIDNEDYYIDLLFFNRSLKSLIAIELKLGKFKAADKGQMELYLRWLDKYERREGENAPLGIILCAEKRHEQVELLQLKDSGIHVAEYLTELPSQEILQHKLQEAIQLAEAKFETQHLFLKNKS